MYQVRHSQLNLHPLLCTVPINITNFYMYSEKTVTNLGFLKTFYHNFEIYKIFIIIIIIIIIDFLLL